jgi:hypothetical protein
MQAAAVATGWKKGNGNPKKRGTVTPSLAMMTLVTTKKLFPKLYFVENQSYM